MPKIKLVPEITLMRSQPTMTKLLERSRKETVVIAQIEEPEAVDAISDVVHGADREAAPDAAVK